MKIYEYNASLLRVVDGDTVDALIDLGFSVWAKKRIRLYNLEEKEQGFKTKERLTELLSANDGKFTLISHGVGKYGRCLGTIIINNVDINELLITEGLAKEYV